MGDSMFDEIIGKAKAIVATGETLKKGEVLCPVCGESLLLHADVIQCAAIDAARASGQTPGEREE